MTAVRPAGLGPPDVQARRPRRGHVPRRRRVRRAEHDRRHLLVAHPHGPPARGRAADRRHRRGPRRRRRDRRRPDRPRRQLLAEGAHRRPQAAHGVLLRLADDQRDLGDRPHPHRARPTARRRPVRVGLQQLPALQLRLLQRPHARRRRGPRPLRLPRRLRLRERQGRRGVDPHGPHRRRRPPTLPAQVPDRLPQGPRPARAAPPAPDRPHLGRPRGLQQLLAEQPAAARASQRSAGYRAAFEWMPRMSYPRERFRLYRRIPFGALPRPLHARHPPVPDRVRRRPPKPHPRREAVPVAAQGPHDARRRAGR